MKISLTPILFALLVFTITPIVTADNSTQDVDNQEVTNNIKERLKEVVSGSDINQVVNPELFGYIGHVTDIIQSTIILEDKLGKKSVRINDDSTIVRSPGSKEIDLANVSVDDSIIAIGSPSGDDEIMGNRIIVSTTALTPPEKISGVASIISVDKYSFSLSVTNSDEPFELFFSKSTTYKSPTNILEHVDLSVGDEILYTASLDSDDDWSATIIMQIKSSDTNTTTE